MPEANQFLFSNKELLSILIREADVHEGRWLLMAVFNFGATNIGPSSDQLAPGAVVAISRIGIQRAEDNTPIELTVDAAEANPAIRR